MNTCLHFSPADGPPRFEVPLEIPSGGSTPSNPLYEVKLVQNGQLFVLQVKPLCALNCCLWCFIQGGEMLAD
jgi:hypothetical protein